VDTVQSQAPPTPVAEASSTFGVDMNHATDNAAQATETPASRDKTFDMTNAPSGTRDTCTKRPGDKSRH
jgi:hypothetical protein